MLTIVVHAALHVAMARHAPMECVIAAPLQRAALTLTRMRTTVLHVAMSVPMDQAAQLAYAVVTVCFRLLLTSILIQATVVPVVMFVGMGFLYVYLGNASVALLCSAISTSRQITITVAPVVILATLGQHAKLVFACAAPLRQVPLTSLRTPTTAVPVVTFVGMDLLVQLEYAHVASRLLVSSISTLTL